MEDEDIDHVTISNSFTGKLIKQMEELLKKPRLDTSLTEKIDAYIFKLQQSQLALQCGVLDTNFAEAGLFLELAKNIWCKKVDLFGNDVVNYMARVSSYEAEDKTKNNDENNINKNTELSGAKNNENIESNVKLQVDVREKKTRRKRKNEPNIIQNDFLKQVQSLNSFADETFITDESLVNYYRKAERLGLQIRSEPSKTECLLFPTVNFRNLQHIKDSKDDEDAIYSGKLKSVITMENLASWRMRPLFDEFSFSIYTELALQPKFQAEQTNQPAPEKNLFTERLLNFKNEWYGRYSDFPKEHEEIDPFDEGYHLIFKHGASVKARNDRLSTTSIPLNNIEHLERYRCFVKLERLTPEQLKSSNDGFISPKVPSVSDDEILRVFQDSAISETALTTENSESASTPSISGTALEPGINESALIPDENISSVEQNDFQSNLTDADQSADEESAINNSTNCLKQEVILKRKINKKDESTPVKEKRPRKSKPVKPQILVTKDLKTFEFFYYEHYNPAEGEGEPPLPNFEDMSPLAYSSEIDPDERDLYDEDSANLSENVTSNPQNELNSFNEDCMSEADSGIGLSLLTVTSTGLSDGGSLSQSNVHTLADSDFNEGEICLSQSNTGRTNVEEESFQIQQLDSEAFERLHEWKSYMNKQFVKLENVEKFDIHEYGTSVLDTLSTDKEVSFKDIVNKKRPNEIARCFQSCLELANKRNIEFVGVRMGELSNDSLKIKLLSRDRHHDAVNDFVLSSAQTLTNRLKMANVVKQGVRRKFSTSFCTKGAPSVKKNNLDVGF